MQQRPGAAGRTGGFGARELALMGLLVAVGTLAAPALGIPVGLARVFPVQHTINVLAGVMLGPWPAVLIAVVISLLRNILGLGTIFAFPGSIFGSFLAGMAYRLSGRPLAAVAGELVGTGIIGALAAYGLARWLLGQEAVAAAFIVSFSTSALAGAVIAYVILRLLLRDSSAAGSRDRHSR